MNTLLLAGCLPEPMAAYLKALGVLRLVAEQADPSARGAWSPDGFLLHTVLREAQLLDFFLQRYAPTPVMAPWNGGSGFHPGDNQDGIGPIRNSSDPRFAAYRAALAVGTRCLERLNLQAKPDPALKPKLLALLRSELEDNALGWLDAVVALLEDHRPAYPPLLGTGGNDGRLDFTNNQMQRLVELLLVPKGKGSDPRSLLRGSLLGEAVTGLRDTAVGQFFPAAAGGANAGAGFTRNTQLNPWDYVLMLEGTLLFGAASCRRLEVMEPGTLVYPFTVRPTGAGYASASVSDGGRGEVWLPLWENPAGLPEVRALFTEGRAQVGRRNATNGLDFARSVASLGVARGIRAFTRYGFQERNGLAYFATPLGRWQVQHHPEVHLLEDLDDWLTSLRIATSDEKSPASLRRGNRKLEEAIFRLCRGGRVEEVLVALAEVEQGMARSWRYTQDKGLRPVPRLDGRWVQALQTSDGPELRLALGLARSGIRERRVPVLSTRQHNFWKTEEDGRTVWDARSLVGNLVAVLLRQEVEETDGRPALPSFGVSAGDLAAFVDGTVDEDRLDALIGACSLLDPTAIGPDLLRGPRSPHPPPLFAVLSAARGVGPEGQLLPRTPGLLRKAATGDAAAASTLAFRRLRGAGLWMGRRRDPLSSLVESPERTRRIAAALLFPYVSPPFLESDHADPS